MSTYTLAVDSQFAERHTETTNPMAEDEALFNRFLRGEDDAFLGLFRRHNRRVFTYCLKIVGGREQAEDIAQETWERIIALRTQPYSVRNPIGFLLRIARNLCLDHLKTRKHHLALDNLSESSHPVHSTGEHSTLEELVLTALHRLSFKYREVLILNTYCGYQFEEIAEMLGKSPEAIWARASRARAELRTIVAGEYAREQKRLQRGNI
jgi:RNA polymerase sigma-70 factor, ECF subfamily